ncbi:FLYWCH-type domain-containing protein [Aphis craccivora]|uniref:FLYWCH-type domain-containing protein n=1 Tax=Aphis craccivora TaxID=307492 RepID=A0A6G0YDZ5_APHCR|nr:FLYWCH-type domain-containing protein [Aphis craccivora]
MEVIVIKENKKIFNGYAYTVHHKLVSNIQWKCSNKNSTTFPAILVTYSDYKNPINESDHSHAGDENLEVVEKAKSEMLKRVLTTTSTPSQMFAEVINQMSRSNLSFTKYDMNSITSMEILKLNTERLKHIILSIVLLLGVKCPRFRKYIYRET